MSTAGTREDKHMANVEQLTQLAEAVEAATGADPDTAAQLAGDVVRKLARVAGAVETFTVYAEDGEYSEQATDIGEALAQFRRRRPDCFVSAVVNDGMRPRLVIEDPS